MKVYTKTKDTSQPYWVNLNLDKTAFDWISSLPIDRNTTELNGTVR